MDLSSCNLKTDFSDYYDHFLTDESDGPFSTDYPRYQCLNLTQNEQLAFLEKAEFDTLLSLDSDEKDEEIANKRYASICEEEALASYRYVQIGCKSFWLKNQLNGISPESEGSMRFSLEETGSPLPARHLRHFRSPVFTIDFLKGSDDRMLALNVDLSPKLADMNFEQWLSPDEVAQAIEETLLC